jgi:prepilin-type N-terminal cleavage/methylation domain-containing protein
MKLGYNRINSSQQGFTLVELIVVITILAILGTIGFISLQGYSADSRDAKRTSDLRSLLSAVNNKVTSGISLTNTVDATINAKLSA